MFTLNKNKFNQLLSVFQKLVEAGDEPPAPWQAPEEVDGRPLFPRQNDSKTLEFLLLLGALNYSYWQKEEGQVNTWGVETENGEKIRDVFALVYCIQRGRAAGDLELNAGYYCDMEKKDVERLFAGATGACELPMLETRVKKINELGEGLQRFGKEKECSPEFIKFCSRSSGLDQFLNKLTDYFPYSFGDPFQKLAQLLFKMIVDRRAENLPPETALKNTTAWQEATQFKGVEGLKAQPDYMLPLFCLKSGLWDIEQRAEKFFGEQIELPREHWLEEKIRELTVETVDQIAHRLSGDPGLNSGRVDSIMWRRAVQGCFPQECEGCPFRDNCSARGEEQRRLDWHHHLTRTTYY